ncbi:SufD family Fe-S cluster assembly protein, partial [Escherichia coli]|nr:SufD family Fe-S cluster assembly protein [Escherichia coli]
AADQPYFTDAVVEIYVDENAHLEHYKVQEEGAASFHVATTWVELKRAARYHSTTVTLGAQLARHNIAAILTEEGGECRVDGLYMVD